MKDNNRRAAIIYLAAALAIILFFGFYLIRTDFIASDPERAVPESSLELADGYTFTILPTSAEPVRLELYSVSGSAGELRLTVSDGTDTLGVMHVTAEGETIVLEPEERLFLQPGKEYVIRTVMPREAMLAVSGSERDGPWMRIYYRWIGRDVLRLVFILSAMLLGLLMFYLTFRKGIRPETVFFIVSVPLCIAFAVIIPALRAPDEVVHFLRAFGVVKGNWIVPPDGLVNLPENIVPEGFSAPYSEVFSVYSMVNGGDILLSSRQAAYSIQNAALYNPLVYVFCCIGIGIADMFSDSFYVILTAGRLVNALGCTLMIYAAIKMIPRGKELVCLISLFPINLQERASISADGPTYAAAVLLTAFVLYMRLSDEKMDVRRMLQLYAILIFTSSCKVVYFAMAALVLLIPMEAFDTKKKAVLHRCAGILLTTVLSLVWIVLASRYLGETQGGGNGAAKVVYALTHPLWYIKLMAVTSIRRLPGWALQMIAPPMGYFDIPVSKAFAAIMAPAAAWLVFRDARTLSGSGQKRDRFASIVLVATSFIVLMLIFASLYVQWTEGTPPMIEAIEGIQGRYFLPFLPALLLGIGGIPEKKTVRTLSRDKAQSLPVCLFAVTDIMVIANIFISCSM